MAEGKLEPHLFVVIGATGDLARRKLLPAMARGLARDTSIESVVLGLARSTDLDDTGYRAWAREALEADAGMDDALAAWCDERLFYLPVPETTGKAYARVADRIRELEDRHDLPGNRIFYLALPPRAFPDAIAALAGAGLNEGPGWTRLVIEKPFGRDLESARSLNACVHQHFRESQVYRIDHYLGKETVRNLLVFRFANPVFEHVWNRDRVESVQITVAESIGVGDRAGYYDQAGALRDMIQNHVTQLLTLTAMEEPAAFDAHAIRSEKVKVLRSITPVRPDHVVLGQYTRGTVDGREVPGYTEEEGVGASSSTETYAAIRVHVANWRWQGVPFYLRTGKRLDQRLTRIQIRFRRPPVEIFEPFQETCRIASNVLSLTLQPDEGFDLGFEVKTPGDGVELSSQRLRFRYSEAFGSFADAYETLLRDVVEGDQTLFVHADEVEAAWRLYDPLLEDKPEPLPYWAGSWGPDAAERLVETGEGWVTG
ncbi:MAG: glucose-6-phosphate dehydrogenase [Gemmatimonadota bacterium]|jgi:glucose-6-phosphate 1-dehydrogenase